MLRKKKTSFQKRRSQIVRRRAKNGGAGFEMLLNKTGRHMYVDLLDLNTGKTLTTISTIPVFKNDSKLSNKDAAAFVGLKMAEYCNSNAIKPAVNIANNRFHGLVKCLVDSFSVNLKN